MAAPAVIVTTPEKCRELAKDASIHVSFKGFGLARADLAHMPEATIPAANRRSIRPD